MDTTTQPLTLTVEQAAKVLGISRSTAYELVHTGDIPSLRLGRRIVVPTAQLAERLGSTVDAVASPATSPNAEDSRGSAPNVQAARDRSATAGTLF